LVPVALAILSESRGPSRTLDLPGVALASSGLLGVVFGIVRAQALGWTSATVVGSMGVGLVLLAGFVAWELRAPARCCRCASSATAPSPRPTGLARDVLRHLWVDLPPGAVLPGGPGLLAARGGLRTLPWTAMPIFVAPGRGLPVRPDREPPADGNGLASSRPRSPTWGS
jgi:hypothetical protein